MNILVFDTEDKLNEAGANIIAGTVQLNPSAVLGLATGGTPVGIYQQLVKAYERGLVSFKEVTAFNLDEYVGINPDHEQSYRYYMRQHLFDKVDFSLENTYIPNGTASDLAEECRQYDELIHNTGKIDLQLLGIGHNGHIGFNEPAESLTSGTHAVELAEATKAANSRYFSSEEEVPNAAITMGVGTILKAKSILLVVKGADKAEIVKRALKGPITTDCPASLLQLHPQLTILLDSAAASAL